MCEVFVFSIETNCLRLVRKSNIQLLIYDGVSNSIRSLFVRWAAGIVLKALLKSKNKLRTVLELCAVFIEMAGRTM